jgi:hypothetical protein
MTQSSAAPPSAPRRTFGDLTVIGPWHAASGRWRLQAQDDLTGETVEKTFPTPERAETWLAELTSGHQAVDPMVEAAPPDKRRSAFEPAQAATLNGHHTRHSAPAGQARDAKAAPFNLRAVAEVLVDYELDPIAEIAKVLMERKVLMRNGVPVIDPETNKPVMVEQVTGLERGKLLVELAQYVRPKLKAVEMKVETKDDLTDEKLAERIGKLMAKLQGAQA